MKNASGEKRLIIAILLQAFDDILNYPSASSNPYVVYRAGSKAQDSQEAKRFVNKNDEMFRYYCHLLGLEPEYVEKKFRKTLSIAVKLPYKKRNKNFVMQELSISK